jgi:hypothetical protein
MVSVTWFSGQSKTLRHIQGKNKYLRFSTPCIIFKKDMKISCGKNPKYSLRILPVKPAHLFLYFKEESHA